MGTLNDLGTSYVESIDPATGYPIDRYEHLLDPIDPRTGELEKDWNKPGTELFNLTSPYGFLQFAIGNGDDFVCMDYRVIKSLIDESTHVIIHGTVNSETGGFIDRFEYTVVSVADAIDCAEGLIDSALEWCNENGIRPSRSGWNQDPYFVLRDLALTLYGPPPFKESGRMVRFGGKRIDAWIKTCRTEHIKALEANQ